MTPLRSVRHPSAEETDKNISSPSTTNKNLVKRLIERCSLQQQDEPTATSTPYKHKDSYTFSNEHPTTMDGHSYNHSNSDNDDEKDDDDENGSNDVGFDQLINEDSDDDTSFQTMNTIKTNVRSSRFSASRHKEQQYEHFQDSDDDDDKNERNSSTTKALSSKLL